MNRTPKHGFGIINSKGFLEKLEEDYRDFDKNHTSARLAINCAITTWHLTDWIYEEFFKKSYSKVEDYQNYIIGLCPDLQLFKDITNGSKHCILKNSHIKNDTVIYEGDFSFEDFDRSDFNVDVFMIELEDGTRVDFEKTLLKVMDFYRYYLKDLYNNLTSNF